MTIVKDLKKLYSISARGKFGFSGGFGLLKFGQNRFGYFSELAGIYSRKKTLKGKQVSRMVFYRPTNPQTIPQQENRNLFSEAINEWASLTEAEKEVYNKKAKRKKISGWNFFISKYMKENK